MSPAASGQYPGAVEITIAGTRLHLTPDQASAIGREIMRSGPEIALALFQAAVDAEAFRPAATALRLRKACEVVR